MILDKQTRYKLGISQIEADMLSTVPHHWVEIKGGAVVFFAKDGKAHFLAYPMVILPENERARFWKAAGRLPLVHEIEARKFMDNPVTAAEFAAWDW